MSDQTFGKKEVERTELRSFLDAYREFTGERLSIEGDGERPDFICRRPSGSNIGIELTKVIRDPHSAFADKYLNRQLFMDPFDALDRIYVAFDRKNEEITGWSYHDDVILVIQLMNCPLSELQVSLDQELQSDYANSRFIEVWIADYTGLEAYGLIELFGLYPLERWGYYARPDFLKPYG